MNIRKVEGLGGIFGGSIKVSSQSLRWKFYFSSSNSLFDHGACGDFFLTNAFAYPNLLPLFLMVTSLN